jgi:NADPH2:quinone reductase
MKAVLCKSYGPPENLSLEEVGDPSPGPGQVLVEIFCSALNFPDTLQIEGKYQFQPPFPFTPGSECSGVVKSTGDGVSKVKQGDRVMAMCGIGGMAEQVLVPEAALRVLPEKMHMRAAAGFNMIYGTSYYALKQRANLKAGETLLVLGASGGVGLAAVELGKAMGAEVIAAASSDEKLKYAKNAGADHLLNYGDGELKEKVKQITGGKGADVIYDPVGGDLFHQASRAIAWDGRLLVIGFASGEIPSYKVNLALLKSASIVGVFWGAWHARSPQENEKNFEEMFKMYEEGKLKPLVTQVFSLEEYAPALNTFLERKAVGKVVLEVKSES